MDLPNQVKVAADHADEVEAQLAGNSAVEAETGTPADPSQENAEAVGSDKWEQKYKTLQGMYNAEASRAKAHAAELEQRLSEYAKQVESLRGSIAEKEQSTEYITEEDNELFGEDLVNMAERAAKKVASQYSVESAKLRSDVDSLREQLRYVQASAGESRRQNYLRRLSERLPDWEAQNTNEGFLAWLEERDPFTGGPRSAALTNAYNDMDADRTAAIFMAYRQSLGQAAPTKAQLALQKQVAPVTRGSAPAFSDNSKRVFTQEDIAQFYENARQHLYTPEQAGALEKEIDLAVAEGRVR